MVTGLAVDSILTSRTPQGGMAALTENLGREGGRRRFRIASPAHHGWQVDGHLCFVGEMHRHGCGRTMWRTASRVRREVPPGMPGVRNPLLGNGGQLRGSKATPVTGFPHPSVARITCRPAPPLPEPNGDVIPRALRPAPLSHQSEQTEWTAPCMHGGEGLVERSRTAVSGPHGARLSWRYRRT